MRSLTRSALTSVFTTGLDLATLTALVELAHVNYVVATFVGTLIGYTSNFLINRYWAFEAGHALAHWQIVRSLPVQAGSSGLHTLGVWLLTAYGHFQYFRSKLVVAAIVYAIWNYPLNRYFVFPKQRKLSSEASAKTSPLSA